MVRAKREQLCSCVLCTSSGVGGGRWYRFIGEDNTAIATAPPPGGHDHCGTAWPGWLSGWGDITEIGAPPRGYNEPGRYPTFEEGIVDGTACFNSNCDSSGDTLPVPVSVVRCGGGGRDVDAVGSVTSDSAEEGGYLLWKLQYTGCSSAYCTDRHTKRESPCASGDYTTLEDEWRSVEHTGRVTLPDGKSAMMTDLHLGHKCPVHGSFPGQ